MVQRWRVTSIPGFGHDREYLVEVVELFVNILDDGTNVYPILSRSLPPNISLSLACGVRTHPIAIDAAYNASGIVVIILIFPVIVSSKTFLAVQSGSRLAANATYLAEM